MFFYPNPVRANSFSKYVVFVSTGRTGTKFLSDYFNSFDKTFAIHEPTESYKLLNSNNFLKSFESDRKKILRMASRNNTEVFIESDGNLRFVLKDLFTNLVNLMCVHIIRNPRDFVRSFASRKLIVDGQEISKYSLTSSYKHLPIDLPHEVNGIEWEKMDVIMKGAWIWVSENERILNSIDMKSNAKTFRFEDVIVSDTYREELFEFIGLGEGSYKLPNAKSVQTNKTDGFLFPEYNEWTSNQRSFFHEVTDSLAAKFSYL